MLGRRAYQYLVQEVLYELSFKGTRGKESVQVGTKKLCYEVASRQSVLRILRR